MGQEEQNTFDEVICALPAHKLAKVEWIGLERTELIEDLAKSTHFPLALIFHGYEKQNIKHPLNGFGFLVPEIENGKSWEPYFRVHFFLTGHRQTMLCLPLLLGENASLIW